MERPQAAGKSDRTNLVILKLSLIPVAGSMYAQPEASSVGVLMTKCRARKEENGPSCEHHLLFLQTKYDPPR